MGNPQEKAKPKEKAKEKEKAKAKALKSAASVNRSEVHRPVVRLKKGHAENGLKEPATKVRIAIFGTSQIVTSIKMGIVH